MFIVLPNVYATQGTISLDQNEFTLYRGTIIPVLISVEMDDYTHYPFLIISQNNEIIYKIQLREKINDLFKTTLGLNANWASGEYTVDLQYMHTILDSKKITILRDNETTQEIKKHPFKQKNILSNLLCFYTFTSFLFSIISKISLSSLALIFSSFAKKETTLL